MPDWKDWKSALAERETREDTRARTSRELLELGTYGYMRKYPEVFDPAAARGRMINRRLGEYCSAEVTALTQQMRRYGELRDQFYGPEATYIRWLIDDKIRQLSAQKEELLGREGFYKQKALPVPDWMQEYMETSMPLEKSEYPYTGEAVGRKGRRGYGKEEKPKASTLRPLGAQAELSPEQMGLMAGYTAWGKAGSPYSYSEGAIRDMADWQRWWEPYTRLSKSLFPKETKLRSRWTTALQR